MKEKRTPQDWYAYQTERIDRYEEKFHNILENSELDYETREELEKLFTWYGNARAMKSKAYQEMKTNKK